MIDPSTGYYTPTETRLAYVKAVRSEEVVFICPEAPLLAAGHTVFVLHCEDGTPILLADTREAAIADALNYKLEAVSLH